MSKAFKRSGLKRINAKAEVAMSHLGWLAKRMKEMLNIWVGGLILIQLGGCCSSSCHS